jgi:hypothetical protein
MSRQQDANCMQKRAILDMQFSLSRRLRDGVETFFAFLRAESCPSYTAIAFDPHL